MDTDERKRQYSALRRAIRASASPALTNKFELCNDSERPGHDTLQLIVLNPPIFRDPQLCKTCTVLHVLTLKVYDAEDLVGQQLP